MRNNDAMQTPHADAGGSRALGIGFVATLIIVLAAAILLTSLGRAPLRSGTSGQSAPIATVRIALNEASEAELALLPEIGDRTAAAIVADRGANGPFTSVEDLQRIRGIGPATVEAIRPFVTVTTRDGGA